MPDTAKIIIFRCLINNVLYGKIFAFFQVAMTVRYRLSIDEELCCPMIRLKLFI